MNGLEESTTGSESRSSDSDDNGETWAQLPPEVEDEEDEEGGEEGDEEAEDVNETAGKSMDWELLLEDSSLASNDDKGMSGVAMSARALSFRSRTELAMGIGADNVVAEVEPRTFGCDVTRMASFGPEAASLFSKEEMLASPEQSDPEDTECESEGDLGGFHRPESASPTQTQVTGEGDDEGGTGTGDISESPSERSHAPSSGIHEAHAANNHTHFRQPHNHNRRASNASIMTANRRLPPLGTVGSLRSPSGGSRGGSPPLDDELVGELTLLEICRRGHHKEADLTRVHTLLEVKGAVRKVDENGKMPIHLLCEAPGHTEKSVELLTLILKSHKNGAKQTVANVRTRGLLPMHLLCSNRHVTEHSEALLRLVLHSYEDAVEMPGGKDGEIPIVMLCRARKFSRGTFLMLKRLVEAHKESVKEKNEEGRTLLHQLCFSAAAHPHTEHTAEAVRVILEAYKRAPEIPDNKGMRPLHVLCLSEQLTSHSVAICKMLLEKYETMAAMQDEEGMLAVHHLCGRERLSEFSLEICRKVLEVFEKGAQVKDNRGRVALHSICESRVLSKVSVDMTRQLMLAHKQAYAVADKHGRLPLHVLMSAMSPEREGVDFGKEILGQLLWTDKAAVETPDQDGRLPLHWLCASGLFCEAQFTMLEKLVEYGKDTPAVLDVNDDNPLHLLCGSKPHSKFTADAYDKLSEALEEVAKQEQEGTDEDGDDIKGAGAKIAGQNGKLALHCLCEAGEHTAESVRMFESLKQANEHGVRHKDVSGKTPLHWLCSAWGHTEYSERIFEELVESLQHGHSQMADMRTKDGLLPIHILCGAGKHTEHSYKIFERLVEAHGESVQLRTSTHLISLNSFMPAVVHHKHDEENTEPTDPVTEDGHMETRIPLGRVPLHFLCGSDQHTEFSVDICQTLLDLYKEAVRVEGDDELQPLHLLCVSPRLTSHSVEICRLVVEEYETQTLEEEESDWRPLLYVCGSSKLSEHSVNLCRLLLESQSRQHSRRNISGMAKGSGLATKWNPLHDLCLAQGHTKHSVEICNQLLTDHKDWAKDTGEEGKLPLHVLCECEGHTECSMEICALLLDANPDAIEVKDSKSGCLPIHLLSANPTLSPFSCKISERLLSGRGSRTPSAVCDRGWTALHHLCSREIKSASDVLLARQLLYVYPQAATIRPADDDPKRDKNMPLHTLCAAERHTAYSVEVCKHLIAANPDAISEPGNQLADETMYDEEDLEGDVPLMMVVKGEKLNANSGKMATMLVDDGDSLPDTLNKLAQKVYRPKGDEVQQRMALRILICLAFLEPDSVMSFFHLDESQNGAHSISFLKEVVDELGLDADNPLHHVLRAGQLYKTLSEHETASVLVARLGKLSDVHVEWAASIVESVSGKVAKRAIWTPEKDSDEFMVGDSPIGIALELGDLEIVSHGAVFDVVKEAWPGEYKFQYNPFSGTMYNNLILEFSYGMARGKDKGGGREFVWMWEKRIQELANPEILNSSPMMMYWLGIFFQTSFLCVFHIVVESSSVANDYRWSLGPASWYLILHVGGGILFEFGQMVGDGLIGYSQDPWNVVDVSMYSLLTIWLVLRVSDSVEATKLGTEPFIPETSLSSEFLGLAAIFIWLRMLNVFGLDQTFGPLVRIIQGMVSNVFAFMVLLSVFLAGFATSLMLIFKRMDQDSPELADSEFPFSSFGDQQVAMLTLLDMALGQFDMVSVFEVSTLAFWVTLFFLAATFIMLFNLLIALMTDTYAKIRQTSEQLWKKDRALLMASYTKTEKMNNKVNLGGILTSLPQPLNLLVVACMIILTPAYLSYKLRNNEKGVGWQKLVNQLLKHVINMLLFFIVCVPFCLIFVFFVLPLNWIFVASSGLLDYLGVDFKSMPSFLKSLLSQAIGVVCCPLIFAAALLATPGYLVHREVSAYCKRSDMDDPDSTHGDASIRRLPSEAPKDAEQKQKRGSIFGNIGGMAFRGSVVSESGQDSQGPSTREITAGTNNPAFMDDQKQGRLVSEKAWEQNLDEDDISALRAAHRATMPVDNTGEDDEAEMLVSEEDAALQEVRNELSKKMGLLDGNQRTLLQTTRDLQIESKTAQQETAASISNLETKVGDMAKESDKVAKSYQEKLEALKLETDDKISRVAELLFYQAEAQQAAFKLQDQKINMLLQSMGFEEADLNITVSFPQTPMWRSGSSSSNLFASGTPPPQQTPAAPSSGGPVAPSSGGPTGGPTIPEEKEVTEGAEPEREKESDWKVSAEPPAKVEGEGGVEGGVGGGKAQTAAAEGPGGGEAKEQPEPAAEVAPVTAPSSAQDVVPPPAAAQAEEVAPPPAVAPPPDAVPADEEKMPPKEEPTQLPPARPDLDIPSSSPAHTPQDSFKAAARLPSSGGSVMDKLFGKLRAAHRPQQEGAGHANSNQQSAQAAPVKKPVPKLAARKPALQALEETMTESQLESKKQMESLSAQISSLAPSLDMLKQVLEVQDSSTSMVQRLQEKLSTMEPALAKLDERLEKAEQQAAASSGELKGSLASLNPQIRALETHLANKQQESSSAIMRAVEERVAAVSVQSEQGTQELLRAWEQKVEAIQRNTDQSKEQLQKVVEDRLSGLTRHVEQKNSELLKVVEDKVERTVAQSSAAVERKMVEQGEAMEQQVQRMVDQQREEMRQQVTSLDDRMVEEITRMDARVKAEMKDMTKKSTERMETQMGTVMETLETKIADTYDHMKEEHTTQINTIHAAISRIPAPMAPPPEPQVDPGPRFTWNEHLATSLADKNRAAGRTPRR